MALERMSRVEERGLAGVGVVVVEWADVVDERVVGLQQAKILYGVVACQLRRGAGVLVPQSLADLC